MFSSLDAPPILQSSNLGGRQGGEEMLGRLPEKHARQGGSSRHVSDGDELRDRRGEGEDELLDLHVEREDELLDRHVDELGELDGDSADDSIDQTAFDDPDLERAVIRFDTTE